MRTISYMGSVAGTEDAVILVIVLCMKRSKSLPVTECCRSSPAVQPDEMQVLLFGVDQSPSKPGLVAVHSETGTTDQRQLQHTVEKGAAEAKEHVMQKGKAGPAGSDSLAVVVHSETGTTDQSQLQHMVEKGAAEAKEEVMQKGKAGPAGGVHSETGTTDRSQLQHVVEKWAADAKVEVMQKGTKEEKARRLRMLWAALEQRDVKTLTLFAQTGNQARREAEQAV